MLLITSEMARVKGVPLGSFNRKLSQEHVPAGGGGGRTTKVGS